MDAPRNLSADKQALLVRRLRGVDRDPAQVWSIPRRPAASAAPLSDAQRQMWVIEQISPGNAAYNLSVAFRIGGVLEAQALEDAFNAVVARHEALRTTFAFGGRRAEQRVHAHLSIRIAQLRLDHLPADAQESAARKLASELAAKPFDLARLPLLRVSLIVLAHDDYVLLICVHHIVADGMSIGLMLREVDAHYHLGKWVAPELPELAVQYADFAAWQQASTSDALRATETEYWRTRLDGAPPALDLPADKVRPGVQSFRGGDVYIEIAHDLAQRIATLAAREQCTAFTVLLAAFQVLLQRYAGTDDIVVGTPLARRTLREVEPLIGNFLNMAALRADLSDDPSVVELLRRDRAVVLDAFSHADLPFELMVKALQLPRDASRNPVFQVMLQVMTMPPTRLGDLRIANFHFDRGTAQVDLALHLYEEAAGYVGRFEYCADLFERRSIERLASHFVRVLEAAVTAPEQPISTIDFANDSEKLAVLDACAGLPVPYPAVRLHELFDAQKARAPARLALIAGETRATYAELDARAGAISAALRQRGVGRGDRVGLCVDRNVGMVAGVLGILRSGAAYVPLDPSFPIERLRYMADDAKIRLLVSDGAQVAPLGLPSDRELRLDVPFEMPAAAAVPDANGQTEGRCIEDPAYVIYTSGSTGRPKGVVVPHRAVVNFLHSMAREPGLSAADILLAVTTLSFDIAVLELQLPLMVGATIVIARRDEAVDGHALAALIDRHRVTVMQATPVTFRMLLDAGWRGSAGFKALVGGEALPRDLAERLIACGADVWNLYGPTETTVWSTCARITDTSRGITIGRPIANTTIRILDARDRRTPIGVPGELCIGGAGVSLGYWNRQDLTLSRFVSDPFSAGAVVYRTGDRARLRDDGMLEHLGRQDDQVKVRGFRIELAEIENVLAEHPAVRQAAVRLWMPKPGDTRIVACCLPSAGQMPTPIVLRRYARARLPEYMVPQHFLTVNALPLTPNGKVDRRRLPTPVVSESGVGREHEAPASSAESAIAAIWTTLIEPVRPIGRSDHFFEIGGHSLLGIQALQQIEDKLGARIEFAALFQESLAEIAARCPQ